MDRHVRWFRREIATGVAQRLAVESTVASVVALGILLTTGSEILLAIMGGVIAFPSFAVLRVGLACASNPMTSAALMRWPHPTGEVHPVEQTNIGSDVDTALKSFRFTARGAFDEWGGSTTNVYTRDSNQIIVASSEDDDLIVLSALHDERLVVTSTQLVPPHEQLIVNRSSATDVRAVLASHVDLIKHLNDEMHPTLVSVGMDDVMRFLAIEWDAWDQIGPMLGPFVAIGRKRQPSLLHVQVSNDDMLQRTGSPTPRVMARPAGAQPSMATGAVPGSRRLAAPAAAAIQSGAIQSGVRPPAATAPPAAPPMTAPPAAAPSTALAAPIRPAPPTIPTEVIPATSVTPPATVAPPVSSLPRPAGGVQPGAAEVPRTTTQIFSAHPLDEVA